MPRLITTMLTAAAVGAASYGIGRLGIPSLALEEAPATLAAETGSKSEPTGAVIYYKHPDGLAEFSNGPRTTPDGRPFVAVRESEDVSFDPEKPRARAEPPNFSSRERKVLFYRNPMGLPDTSKVPKKDSMGMDYLPVYEGEAVDSADVKVSSGKLQRTGVKTALAQKAKISRSLSVPGVVVMDERLISTVSMRSEAFIERVADVTTGQRVRKGDLLFEYYSKEIAAAGAQLITELSSPVPQRPQSGAALRLKNLGVPSAAIEEIAAERRVPPTLKYSSPRDGIVLERTVVDGMMAEPGATLFRLGDLSRVWVIADLPESELGMIKIGETASVSFKQKPGLTIRGTIDTVYPEVQMQTRTAKVRIGLPNPDGFLLPNMYALVSIDEGAAQPVVAVPRSAVVNTGDRQIIFIDRGDGRFEPKDVKTGTIGDDLAEIRDGVEVGDRIVVAANFLLDAESNLNSALSSMSADEAAR